MAATATLAGGEPGKALRSFILKAFQFAVMLATTLFGLLAVSLAVNLSAEQGPTLSHALAAVFFVLSMFFVYRSFYGMRIGSDKA